MNRGTLWADDEVLTLIKVWGNDKIQEELDEATRNKVIFAKISEEMKKEGYNRDWQQCRGKIKNLKGEYRVVKDHLAFTRPQDRTTFNAHCVDAPTRIRSRLKRKPAYKNAIRVNAALYTVLS